MILLLLFVLASRLQASWIEGPKRCNKASIINDGLSDDDEAAEMEDNEENCEDSAISEKKSIRLGILTSIKQGQVGQ